MDKKIFSIVIRSNAEGGNQHRNFNIQFGHVLPTNIKYFKCKVENFAMNAVNAVDINDEETGNPAFGFQLIANFSYINTYVSNKENFPIAILPDLARLATIQQHYFIIENFNFQTINFKVLTLLNNPVQNIDWTNNVFTISAEAIE